MTLHTSSVTLGSQSSQQEARDIPTKDPPDEERQFSFIFLTESLLFKSVPET